MRVLVVLAFTFFSFAASASSQGLSCTDLNDVWANHYAKDFEVLWHPGALQCDTETAAAQAFYDLEHTVFSTRADGMVAPDFYGIVKSAIQKINLHSMAPACKTAIAFASHGTLNLCPQFYSDQREDRASTLAHESRHLQAGDPGHAKCVRGANAGVSGGCDQKFTDGERDGGGFNSDVNFLSWIVRSDSRNELSRHVAQAYLKTYVPDRFNEITPEQIRKFRHLGRDE